MSGLVSTAALAAELHDPDLVVLDTRSGPNARAAFEAAHIPGARHTDYVGDGWRARVGAVPGLLPEPSHRAALFARLGLRPASRIVIVPAGAGVSELAAAARIYWTLGTSGFRHLALLDGGMAAWQDEARPVEQGAAANVTAPAQTPGVDPAFRVDAAAGLAALEAGAAFVDARAPSYFAGYEKAPEAVSAGHIPGAINVDYTWTYDPLRQRLKPRAELEALFAEVSPGPVISYCNTGHTAALTWFVLSEVLGRPDVRLYDGSMTDWTQDPARPVVALV